MLKHFPDNVGNDFKIVVFESKLSHLRCGLSSGMLRGGRFLQANAHIWRGPFLGQSITECSSCLVCKACESV